MTVNSQLLIYFLLTLTHKLCKMSRLYFKFIYLTKNYKGILEIKLLFIFLLVL